MTERAGEKLASKAFDGTRSYSEVVRHVQTLIGFDTSNPGSTEEAAAQYVANQLASVGIAADVFEPEAGRCSVISHHAGARAGLSPLVVHCHLDTVPFEREGWTHDPLGGAIAEGCIWGRGAVDMKNIAGMMLEIELYLARQELKPRRDIVFAYFADEEGGCRLGSAWIAEHAPHVFRGATEAIGEVGGFTVTTAAGLRIYPIQVAERGVLWFRAKINGKGGHAAFAGLTKTSSALAAEKITAVGNIRLPRANSPEFNTFVASARAMLGPEASDGDVIKEFGEFGRTALLGGSTTFVPTTVQGGEGMNLVPSSVEFYVDCRFVPGQENEACTALRLALGNDVTVELVASMPGLSSPTSGPLMTAIRDVIASVDPAGHILPFVFPAATDAQRLARLGMTCYGFTPLVSLDGFEYLSLFHAIDERVQIEALEQGREALLSLLMTY